MSGENIPKWLRQVEKLDIERGISYCGNEAIYIKALRKFVKSMPEKSEELAHCYYSRDWEGYIRGLHSLKSVSKTLGAVEISELAQKLEEAGSAGNYPVIETDSEDFFKQFDSLWELLRPLAEVDNDVSMGDFQGKAAVGGSTVEISREQLRDALQTIKEYAGVFDYEGVRAVLETMEEYVIPEQFQNVHGQLIYYVERLNWDKIKDTIKEYEDGVEKNDR